MLLLCAIIEIQLLATKTNTMIVKQNLSKEYTSTIPVTKSIKWRSSSARAAHSARAGHHGGHVSILAPK